MLRTLLAMLAEDSGAVALRDALRNVKAKGRPDKLLRGGGLRGWRHVSAGRAHRVDRIKAAIAELKDRCDDQSPRVRNVLLQVAQEGTPPRAQRQDASPHGASQGRWPPVRPRRRVLGASPASASRPVASACESTVAVSILVPPSHGSTG